MVKILAKTKAISKGKVYIQTTKGVYPYSVLQKAEISKSSSQIKSVSRYIAENDLIPPPYIPETLLLLYESNPIFWRCVEQLANDVAGLGWALQLREGQKDNESEKKRLNEFLSHPNSEDSLRRIMKQLLIDWGAIGWFGLEVVRNNKGDIAEIYHVPAHTLRVHRSNEKYCQIRNNKKVWFKKYGIEGNINSKNGEKGGTTLKTRANELIFYRNFYPKSDYYGVPNALASIGDIVGMIGLRDYNLAFFENYGVPSAIIVLEGEWEKGSEKKVQAFLNKELKGNEHAHRTLVVTQPDKCTFTYKPLGLQVKEASFKLYEQGRRENILIAYSMPPERVGIRITGSLGGNVAEEATRIYIQGVVEPLQTDLEEIINEKLIKSEVYEFKFENIDLRNLAEIMERHNNQIEHGTMTPNESRKELGLKEYPEGDKFYMMSNLMEIGASDDESIGKTEQDFLDNAEDS